jgi:hypothetical protein
MTSRTFLILPAAIALLPAACASDGTKGALGQANASADCAQSDLTCVAKGLDGPLAVGAAVKVNVAIAFQGAAAPATRLVSSHPGVLVADEGSGGVVRGAAPGNATLLVMLAEQDAVIDFLHVWVAKPDRLAMGVFTTDERTLGENLTRTEMVVDDDLILTAQLFAGGQSLLGAANTVWTVDSEFAAVTLLREGPADRVRAVARGPGLATVSLEVGDLTATLEVEVKP